MTKKRQNERNKAWQRLNKTHYLAQNKTYRLAWTKSLKLEVIAAYGGKCFCCGEKEPVFLGVHHIDNDGSVERKNQVGNFYYSLKKRNWPKEKYTLACMNCNWALRYGKCPHKRRSNAKV